MVKKGMARDVAKVEKKTRSKAFSWDKKEKSFTIESSALRIAIIVAVVAAIAFLDYNSVFVSRTFNIPDRCGVVMKNVMHTIESDTGCEVRCRNQCEVMEMTYKKSSYKQAEKGCNECRCICRSIIGKE